MEGYCSLWQEVADLYDRWQEEAQRFCVRSLVRYWWARGELQKRFDVTALQPRCAPSSKPPPCLSPNKTPLAEDTQEDLLIWLCIGCEVRGYDKLPIPATHCDLYAPLLKRLVMYRLGLLPNQVRIEDLEKAHDQVFR